MHVDNLHLAYFVVHMLHGWGMFALEVERTGGSGHSHTGVYLMTCL
jgi:hypothetical protein